MHDTEIHVVIYGYGGKPEVIIPMIYYYKGQFNKSRQITEAGICLAVFEAELSGVDE